MGTYYAIGVVKKFSAKSNQTLSQTKWKEYLNERLDIEQYTVHFEDNTAEGELKQNIFQENIEDFYNKLVQITCNDKVSFYFEVFGTEIEQYQNSFTEMTIKRDDHHITLTAELAVLFIEGKVSVEEFNIEPSLMNWLFRQVDLSNPLSGCIMSDIVG